MTTWLKVKSAGKVQIILEMEVTGKKSYKTAEIQTQILTALYNAYSPEQAQIGGSVRLSDIYALIDNLSTVDYLHLTKFYIKPWPTTIYGNKELNLGQFKLNKAKGSMTYYITFNSSTTFTVRSVSNGYVTTGSVGSSIQIIDKANGLISLWTFRTTAINRAIGILLRYQNLTMIMKTPVLTYQYSKMLHN